MFKVDIQKYDYVNKVVAGRTIENVVATGKDTWNLSYSALIRAALLVGRQSMLDIFHFGEWSKLELRWRSAILRANTNLVSIRAGRTSQIRLVPTPAFKALDGSEKTAVSYLLGVAAAKIMAERECDVRWLMHLDVYSKPDHPYTSASHLVENFPNAAGRPDLIGRNLAGEWAVIEAKGRSSKADDALRLKSKKQTQKVMQINGRPPRWRLASIGQLVKDGFKIDVVDPIDPLEDAFSLGIPPDLFMRLAYRTLFELLLSAERKTMHVRDQAFVTLALPEIDLTIGLKDDIFSALAGPDITRVEYAGRPGSLAEAIVDSVRNIPQNGFQEGGDGFSEYSIGPDGILVGLGDSWNLDPGFVTVPPLAPFKSDIERALRGELGRLAMSDEARLWSGDLSHHIGLPRNKLILK